MNRLLTEIRYPLSMKSGMRRIVELIKDWRVQWPKQCEYNNQNEDTNLNGKEYNKNNSSFEKFKLKFW